jgi:hypothetical protein
MSKEASKLPYLRESSFKPQRHNIVGSKDGSKDGSMLPQNEEETRDAQAMLNPDSFHVFEANVSNRGL